MSAAIDIRDAFRIYRSHGATAVALQGLTLTVEPGEIVVVLGPSGSGKTTLLRAVAGLDLLSAGRVEVFGQDWQLLSPSARAEFRATKLGFLDQHYLRALSPDLTCRDNVALQLELAGRERAAARRTAEDLLGEVGLGDRAGDRPALLSGGEQQRVAVCAAIAHRPGLLLADEPAGELDAENAAIVYTLIAKLTRAQGASALIVSHDQAATQIADRLVTIRDGQLVEQARPGEESALVVSRSGRVNLPTRLYEGLGRPALVTVEREDMGVLLQPHERADPAPAPVARMRRAAQRTIIEFRSLAKTYRGDRVVFAGLGGHVDAGGVLGVVGRSGTGKTTLLHLLAGLVEPDAGEILIDGRPLPSDRSGRAIFRRDQIALVTQEPGLVPYLTARENVALALRIRAKPGSVDAVLEQVGLSGRADHRAASLSTGERQRLALARALAVDVPVIMVDEPSARLDEENGRLVGALLAAAARERGHAVVYATHDQALVELADDVIDLDRAERRAAVSAQRIARMS